MDDKFNNIFIEYREITPTIFSAYKKEETDALIDIINILTDFKSLVISPQELFHHNEIITLLPAKRRGSILLSGLHQAYLQDGFTAGAFSGFFSGSTKLRNSRNGGFYQAFFLFCLVQKELY